MHETFCKRCQYFSLSQTFCLLGRNIHSCDSQQARRSDERLVERLRTIPLEEFRKMEGNI